MYYRDVQKTSARLLELATELGASSHNLADVFLDNPVDDRPHMTSLASNTCVGCTLLSFINYVACVFRLIVDLHVWWLDHALR